MGNKLIIQPAEGNAPPSVDRKRKIKVNITRGRAAPETPSGPSRRRGWDKDIEMWSNLKIKY